MYVVTVINGTTRTVAHEPGDSDVKLEGCRISREVNCFDSLSFTIYPPNPAYDLLEPFSTKIEVTNIKTGKLAFEGRVIQPLPSMDSDGTVSKSVTCESCMGYLCDSMQMWKEEQHYGDTDQKTGLATYIEGLLERHNESVEDYKKIYPGEITLQTFETSGGVTKGIDRASTWENISDKLIDVFGGEMRVRRGSDGLLYLDYAKQLGTTRATRIEIARNMDSAEREIDPSDVITRFYPFGCKLTETVVDEEGEEVEQETEERLTIESVNDGKAYIDDTVAIGQYGIIEGFHEWDDVTVATNLMMKAQEWLGENNAMPVSHTIDAYDLSLIGLDYDSFELHDSYPCYNPLIDIDETLEIVKQTIDICEPENSSFDMGTVSRRLSNDLTHGATQGDIQKVESTQNTAIVNLESRINKSMASITVDTDAIVSQVTSEIEETYGGTIDGLEAVIQDTSTRVSILEQTDEGWAFNFEALEETITQIGEQVTTSYGQIIKYIRLIDGVITIGIEGNDVEMKLFNDRVSILQGNIEVAYFSNNKLYVKDAEILNRLDIGMFSFIPSDDGNMSIRYRG